MATENPLVLGNAEQESLSAILRRSRQNKFMMMMNLYGPAGLFRMLPKKTRLELQTERYTDVCSLCLSITNTPEYVRILKTRLTAEDTSVRLSAGMLLRDVDRHLSLDRKMTANSQHRADF